MPATEFVAAQTMPTVGYSNHWAPMEVNEWKLTRRCDGVGYTEIGRPGGLSASSES